MALFLNAHAGAFLDGVAVAGQDLRLQLAAAMLTGASPSGTTGIAARPGVRYGTGNPLQVNAASGMNVTINAGVAFVQGTASATAGMYTCCLDTTGTVTVATSDPVNPRIDNVICQITDVGTSSSTTVVTLQTGAPAPSPVAPTLPANSLLLATIAVGANVSSITAGNITDARVYTAVSGGIVPVANTVGGISGAAGMYAHDLSSGRLKVSDGSGNARAPKIAPWAPMDSGYTTNTTFTGVSNTLTINSVSGTFDGITEAMVIVTWQSVIPSSPTVGDLTTLNFLVDGSGFAGGHVHYIRQDSTSSTVGNSGTAVRYTTPTSGTHTVSVSGNAPSGYQMSNLRIRVVAMNS